MQYLGLSPLTVLRHPIRTLKWIVTYIPMMNQMRRTLTLRTGTTPCDVTQLWRIAREIEWALGLQGNEEEE